MVCSVISTRNFILCKCWENLFLKYEKFYVQIPLPAMFRIFFLFPYDRKNWFRIACPYISLQDYKEWMDFTWNQDGKSEIKFCQLHGCDFTSLAKKWRSWFFPTVLLRREYSSDGGISQQVTLLSSQLSLGRGQILMQFWNPFIHSFLLLL